MAVIRANVESILIRRTGRLLTAVQLDGTTVSGSNADLNDPIGAALRALGYTVTTLTAVSDADLSAVPDSRVDHLLDLAELRTLESALENFDGVNVTLVDGHKEDLDQIGKRLEAAIARKTAMLAARYGPLRPSVSPYAGGISVSDKETQEEDTDRVVPAFNRTLHTHPGTLPTIDDRRIVP